MIFRFGVFELDPDNAELRKSGAALKLSPQPFQVLHLLVVNAGQLVGRDQIRRQVWGEDTFVDFDRNLNVCMAQIRAVLSDDAEAARFIQTVPRRGYRFVAPVDNGAPRQAGRRRIAAIAAVVGVAVVAAGLLRGGGIRLGRRPGSCWQRCRLRTSPETLPTRPFCTA